MDITFSNILYFIFVITITVLMIKTIVKEVRNKSELDSWAKLNQIEIFYLFLLIGLYFYIIVKSHNLTDLYVIVMIILSLFVTLIIPFVLKIRVKINSLRLYKPFMFLLLAFVAALMINSIMLYNRYIGYYGEFPTTFVFNKDTAFNEFRGEISKECELDSFGLNCHIPNLSKLFNDYYFDTATINIKTESEINQINNPNVQMELLVYYSNHAVKEYNMDEIIIDDFTLTMSDDGYTILINLNDYLREYHIEDYSIISLTFQFVDKDAGKSINFSGSDYKIILTKQ